MNYSYPQQHAWVLETWWVSFHMELNMSKINYVFRDAYKWGKIVKKQKEMIITGIRMVVTSGVMVALWTGGTHRRLPGDGNIPFLDLG